MNSKTLVPAVIVSPLIMPAAWVVSAWFKGVALGEILSGVLLFFVPVSYLIGAVLGIPMLIVFRRFRLTSMFAYVFGGALIGLLVAYLFQELLSGQRQDTVAVFLICIVGSAISALVFRLIMFGWKYQEGK